MRADLNIDFIGKRRVYYTISITLIALGILVSFIFHPLVSIEFTGGSIVKYVYTGTIDKNKAEDVAQKAIPGAVITTSLDVNYVTHQKTVVYQMNRNLTPDGISSLYSAVAKNFPSNKVTKGESQTVSASMGASFIQRSVLAVALASLLIILYIWIRFRKIGGLPAGLTAFIALLHDVAMVYVAFTLMRIPLDDNFIAVTLTILGYSINDTIVVYDRVRENRRLYGSKMLFKDTVNKSINQSFARSVNTTLVTFVSIGVLAAFSLINHLDSVTSFALPMMVGVVTGCYSTICIAGPLWVGWETHKEVKAAEEKQRLAKEREERHQKLEEARSKRTSGKPKKSK